MTNCITGHSKPRKI
nr:unnamed protein product [Callosobruchus chinensis]